jgi:hypothetical protein
MGIPVTLQAIINMRVSIWIKELVDCEHMDMGMGGVQHTYLFET